MSDECRYEVWCSAHIAYQEKRYDTPWPKYATTTLNEARKLRAQANRECQAEGLVEHFITRDGSRVR